MSHRVKAYFGDRAFYKSVLVVLIPIIIQNTVTNFVSLLDNLMVGRVGTAEMSGVAIANQLIFVFYLAVFGAVSGAGIFTAQFSGAGDHDGIRATMRFKLLLCSGITLIFMAVFLCFGDRLVGMYLNEADDVAREAATLDFAMRYLRILLIGFLPYTLTQCYADTLRQTGQTTMPMTASVVAVAVNTVFNYLLIFGRLGFPRLGVEGAAIATVLSRFAELGIVTIYTHTHAKRHPFVRGLYASMHLPGMLARRITVKTMPLMMNEFLWSLGMAVLNQIYSLRGLDTVAAMNITTTVYNLFSVACFSMGSASGILIGRRLGADDVEGARADCRKMVMLSVLVGALFSAIMFALSAVIPMLYNVSDGIRALATSCIRVCALFMIVFGIVNCEYFTLRSGGKTFITFLFDSVFVWALVVPSAYAIAHLTNIGIVPLYAIVSGFDVIKLVIGYVLLKKGIWINNIISQMEGEDV